MTVKAQEEHEHSVQVAQGVDQREANVFAVAAMILGRRLDQQARKLLQVSARYFSSHSGELIRRLEGCAR